MRAGRARVSCQLGAPTNGSDVGVSEEEEDSSSKMAQTQQAIKHMASRGKLIQLRRRYLSNSDSTQTLARKAPAMSPTQKMLLSNCWLPPLNAPLRAIL